MQALWFFTSDLVFVLLFPQLVFALFDPRANRAGSIAAFVVSLALRLGGGEPLFGCPPSIPYPELFSWFLAAPASALVRPGDGALLFPFKTLAARPGSSAARGVAPDGPVGSAAAPEERGRPGAARGPRGGRGDAMKAAFLAWSAHAYTALGLPCAAAMAVLIVRGGDASFRLAFALMVAATAVDATDGLLARRFRVGDVLPGFDGRRLDDLIDFQTYTALPLLLVWRAGLVPAGWEWWLVAPLVASAYGFCQADAKTDDDFFLGFPSYWNVVAFYLYVLRLPQHWALALLLALAVLTFVPARYLYTSRAGRWSALTNVAGTVWAAALAVVLWRWEETPRWLPIASLAFPLYYMALSWSISVARWRGGR